MRTLAGAESASHSIPAPATDIAGLRQSIRTVNESPRDVEVTELGRMKDNFEQVALPFFDAVFGFALSLTHDRSAADDLVQ